MHMLGSFGERLGSGLRRLLRLLHLWRWLLREGEVSSGSDFRHCIEHLRVGSVSKIWWHLFSKLYRPSARHHDHNDCSSWNYSTYTFRTLWQWCDVSIARKSIPHPTHCRNFYTCYGKCAVLGLCELGKWFDREGNVCNYSHKVTNCPANQD